MQGDIDTLITFEAIEATGAMSRAEIAANVELVRNVAGIVSQEVHRQRAARDRRQVRAGPPESMVTAAS